MAYRNGIIATIALALSSLALAAVVSTDDYARAARAEAFGFHALTEQVAGVEAMAFLDAPAPDAPALLSAGRTDTVRR